MNKIMKLSGVMVSVMLAGSVTMAGPCDGRGGGRGWNDHSDYRPSHSSNYRGYDRDRHGGYYHDDHVSLAAGLFGLAVVAAVATVAFQAEPVYVEQQVIYTPSPPPVVYVRPQTVVVQQPIYYEPPQPLTMILNVQNSNGSMTPVTMRQIGAQWVGPKGEYYDNLPTIGQLRPIYGF